MTEKTPTPLTVVDDREFCNDIYFGFVNLIPFLENFMGRGQCPLSHKMAILPVKDHQNGVLSSCNIFSDGRAIFKEFPKTDKSSMKTFFPNFFSTVVKDGTTYTLGTCPVHCISRRHADAMARLWDLRTLIRSAFSPKLNSLAMMTGNLLSSFFPRMAVFIVSSPRNGIGHLGSTNRIQPSGAWRFDFEIGLAHRRLDVFGASILAEASMSTFEVTNLARLLNGEAGRAGADFFLSRSNALTNLLIRQHRIETAGWRALPTLGIDCLVRD
ncbi:hypothetical protein Tco_0447894 [Tanacetum coccineum]